MRPDERFLGQPKNFWAHIRTISRIGQVKAYALNDCLKALTKLGLRTDQFANDDGVSTPFGEKILEYVQYRADVLNNTVEGQLMNVTQAKKAFTRLKKECQPTCPLPMNKQKWRIHITGLRAIEHDIERALLRSEERDAAGTA